MQYEISVIIPVYNTADFLPECVDSVIQEPGFANMQVLLVDDGSTDDSAAICKEYCDQYPNIELVSFQEPPYNRGLSAARNLGLRNAKGSYVFFLDSDDMVSDGYIGALHQSIQEKQCDIVYGGFTRFIDQDRQQVFRQILTFDDVVTGIDFLNRRIDLNDDHNYVWCAMYRRQFLADKNIHFDENVRLYEDLVFTPQVALAARKVGTTLHNGYLYRIRTGSLVQRGVSARDVDAMLLVMQRLKPLLEKNGGIVGRYHYVLVSMCLYYLGVLEDQKAMDSRQLNAYYTKLTDMNLFPALRKSAVTRKERMKWKLWRINWRLFYRLVKKQYRWFQS